jgi:hypothetical protein
MYDDAYVIVGHLDASGRLKIVFPSQPGDDGFVRGDKIYHVPSFFAGFVDDYAWRYSNDYRYRYHSAASKYDSYDASLGYVFVIASWRPMRLDRIADGNRWTTYDVSDVSYMQDPREAIEELGSLIAGDNREAYTIEYAHYTTTNYGTYSMSSADYLYSNGCSGYSSFGYSRFFTPFLFSPYSGFGYSQGGCYSQPYYYGYPVAYTPTAVAPPPVNPRGRPAIPIGAPVFHGPGAETGTVAVHRPDAANSTPTSGTGANSALKIGTYHRPGLIAEDAPGPHIRGQGRVTGTEISPSSRPTIQQMIGSRRTDQGGQSSALGDARIRNAGARDNGWSSTNRGGVNITRSGAEAGSRWNGDNGNRPAHASGGESHAYTPPSRSAPARTEGHSAPRGEASHAAPARSEPAARSAPARSSSGSSSSGSSKKP